MPTTNKHEPLISLRGIGKGYLLGGQPLQILKDVCLDIFPGESCAIVGASGSGKSTLLNILGLLDRPDSGAYRFAEHDIFSVDGDRLAARAAPRSAWSNSASMKRCSARRGGP